MSGVYFLLVIVWLLVDALEDVPPAVLCDGREPILCRLELLHELVVFGGLLFQRPLDVDGLPVDGGAQWALSLRLLRQAMLVERMHAEEVHRRLCKGHPAVRALAVLEYPGPI